MHVGKGQKRSLEAAELHIPARPTGRAGGEEHEDLPFSSNFTPADIRGVNISTHHKKHPLYPSHMCTLLGSCKPSGDEPDLRTGSCDCFQTEKKKCRYAYTVCFTGYYTQQLWNFPSVVSMDIEQEKLKSCDPQLVNLYTTNRANTQSFSAMDVLMLL